MEDKAEIILREFISTYQSGGFDTLDDTSLRRELYSRFYTYFQQLGLAFTQSKAAHGISYNTEEDEIRLTPVKSAYPTKEKFDVAILAPGHNRPPTGSGPDEQYQLIWQQPVDTAIRLSLCKDAGTLEKYLKAWTKEARQFETYQKGPYAPENFTGLSLLLISFEPPQALLDQFRLVPGRPAPEPGIAAWLIGSDECWYQASADT